MVAIARDLRFQAAWRGGHDHRADACDDDEHEGVQEVDAVLDAPGRLPAAEVIADGAAVPEGEHTREQREGHDQGPGGHQHRKTPAQTRPAQQHTQGRREQRQGNLQGGQVLAQVQTREVSDGDHRPSSMAAMSSSSIVP